MIGRRDERRKEEAVKKAEMELKKKEKEAVREVYVLSSETPATAPVLSLTGCCRRPQMPSSMFFQHNTALVPVSTYPLAVFFFFFLFFSEKREC